MKTALTLGTVAVIIWIHRRRERAKHAELAERVGAYYAEAIRA